MSKVGSHPRPSLEPASLPNAGTRHLRPVAKTQLRGHWGMRACRRNPGDVCWPKHLERPLMPKTPSHIALLGWGSLLWDPQKEFDEQHEAWQFDGPVLPLEFSRVSSSRGGALTLVIDTAHGAPCRSAYAISRRTDPDEAIIDLRCREGTIMRHMGFYFRDGSRRGLPAIPEPIPPWAELHGIDVVIWTGLPNNFEEKTGQPFSIASATKHLQNLPAEVKASAAEYIWRAPCLVDTPLRAALQSGPWFESLVRSERAL